MRDHEFRELLNLVMCCDPWPVDDVSGQNRLTIIYMVTRESVKRNYPNWTDAYHNFEVTPDEEQ